MCLGLNRMFAGIEKQLKQLESNKISLKKKNEICQEVELSLRNIDQLVSQSLTGNKENVDVNIDNVDQIMDDLAADLDEMKEQFEMTVDLEKLVEIKQKIQACKEFFSGAGDLTICIANDEGILTDITKKIKDGILIQQLDD